MDGAPTMPSDVDARVGFFDRLASAVAAFASRAWFFSLCILLIVMWVPSIVWFPLDTWQLIINTATTIVTFLLVALLQNTQTRADAAVQHKLNAIAQALAELIEQIDGVDAVDAAIELRQGVGLEQRESA
jgi:low affinity Fe/Cu permease